MQFLAVSRQRFVSASVVGLSVLSMTSASYAVTIQQVPNPRKVNGGWVTDMAEILTPATEKQLNQLISDLEAKTGDEIAVVTVPETKPAASPKKFATALFNNWGIGKAGKNNGVLLLVAQTEKRVEIETGNGVQSILPNAKAGEIINTEITPRFQQGDFNGGTLAGTKAVVVALQSSRTVAANLPQTVTASPIVQEPSQDEGIPRSWLALGGGVAVLAAMGLANRFQRKSTTPSKRSRFPGQDYDSSSSSDSSSYDSSSSSDSGSSSYSGGSGSSFGGGDSGGGGAGGSW